MTEHLILALKVTTLVVIGVVIYYMMKRGLQFLHDHEYLPVQLFTVVAGIIRWLLIIVIVLTGLRIFGVSVESFWAALSAIGALIAVGFVASWSILSNILSAALLIIFSPFRVGDEIEIIEPTGASGGLRGTVVGLNILYTTLEQIAADTEESFLIEVPNNLFFQKSIRRKHGVSTQNLREGLALSRLIHHQHHHDAGREKM